MKATELTQSEKIRILATKGMGWEVPPGCSDWYAREKQKGHRYKTRMASMSWNPFASLDTVAEIEARLTEPQRRKYANLIYSEIVGTAPIIGTQRLYWG